MNKKIAALLLVLYSAFLLMFFVSVRPVQAEAGSGASTIQAADSHSIALKNGKVWAWGVNVRGQMGDGTGKNSSAPVQLHDLTDIVAIAAGFAHSLALEADGTVWAWGYNDQGMIGDGSTDDRMSPVQVVGLSDVIAVAAGFGHSIALKEDGTVWSWGRNHWGQLGNGSDPGTKSLTPVQVSGLTDVVAIAAGDDNNFAVKSDGTIWGWGKNFNGHLGDGTQENKFTPVQVSNITLAEGDSLVIGGDINYVVKSDGTVWGWGYGILGDGGYTFGGLPKQIHTLSDVVAMSASFGHALALKSDGTVWAFGSNDKGQLGIGNYDVQLTPVQVSGLTDIVAVEAGGQHNFAVKSDGTVWGWGQNGFGQLGDGTNHPSPVPVQVQFDLPASDARLSALSLSAGALSPVFDPKTFSYTSEVPNGIDQVTVTATAMHANATVSGTGTFNLNVGTNEIHVTVTAENGNTATYVITVFRAPSSNANLAALSTSAGSLSPAFSPETLVYTLSVSPDVNSMTVTATVYDSSSSIKINGAPTASGMPSEIIALPLGATIITVEVTAQDGLTTKTYQITVTREGSANALLGSLMVDQGSLKPAFDPNHDVYTLDVPYTAESVSVTAAVYHDQAKLKMNGETLTSGDALTIPLKVGETIVEIEVTAQDGVTTKTYQITVTRQSPPPPANSGPGSPATDEAPAEVAAANAVKVTINGISLEDIVESDITQQDGRSAVTVSVDASRLAEALESVENGTVVIVSVEEEADEVSVALAGDAIKALDNKQAVLVVATPNGTYYLPAAEVNIEQLSETFGQAALAEIVVRVEIAKSPNAKVQQLKEAAKAGGFAIAAMPVDFNISASHNGKTMEIARFSGFVKREIPLPAGVNPDEVSTAVLQEEDGAVRHVPTSVEVRDGKAIAVIRSLSNSTYALISRSVVFSDVNNHWAEAAIRDLASRMIVSGQGAGRFHPDAAVTRAEFAAIAVRALGLSAANGDASFADVKSGDWFGGAVATAEAYGMLSGYEDGSFRPADAITRQEAVVVLARMMQLAGMDAAVTDEEAILLLSGFTDGAETAVWARAAAAAAVKHGLVAGADGKLHLTDKITRAETAAIVHRLLQRAGLIDEI